LIKKLQELEAIQMASATIPVAPEAVSSPVSRTVVGTSAENSNIMMRM